MGIDPRGELSYFIDDYEHDMTNNIYLYKSQLISYDDLPNKIKKDMDYVSQNINNYKYNGQNKKGSNGFLGIGKKPNYQWQKKNSKGEWVYVKEGDIDKRIRQALIQNFWSEKPDCNYVITPTNSTIANTFYLDKNGTTWSTSLSSAKCVPNK
jgi:hypothetical protein